MSTRGLSKEFMESLKEGGILNPILKEVHNDQDLILEIRENYINIYYRGVNLAKITEKIPGQSYDVYFDSKYAKGGKERKNIENIMASFQQIDKDIVAKNLVLLAFPEIKKVMDNNLNSTGKLEKEFQQLIVRENNNLKTSNDTDYYIVDFEYTNSSYTESRSDLMAIHWNSTGPARRNPKGKCNLAIVEVKFGDGALDNDSGMEDHVSKTDKILSDETYVSNLKTEMLNLFKQKRELELVQFGKDGNNHEVSELSDDIEFIFILAAHKPSHTRLKVIVDTLEPMKKAQILFASSSFMGYSLFGENMLTLDQFKQLLNDKLA
jgi:hypothetical protein